MKKTIIISGARYDMSLFGGLLDDVRQYVQADLDYIYGKGSVTFDIAAEPNGYRLIFYRTYGDFYKPSATPEKTKDAKFVFSWDRHILLGDQCLDHPTQADFLKEPNGSVVYDSLDDVFDEYKKQCKSRGKNQLKVTGLDVCDYADRVEFLIEI